MTSGRRRRSSSSSSLWLIGNEKSNLEDVKTDEYSTSNYLEKESKVMTRRSSSQQVVGSEEGEDDELYFYGNEDQLIVDDVDDVDYFSTLFC